MKLFRVLMTVYVDNGCWESAHSIPTFYVHAVNGEHASGMAKLVTRSMALKTSGSAIEVDSAGDAIVETYYGWAGDCD